MPERDIVERLREAAARFHASYIKSGPDECWEWQRKRFSNGYARSNVAGTSLVASRAMMTLLVGNIDPVLEVCHTCDNRNCVNPQHLWIGTTKQNAEDKIAKGRGVYWVGEANKTAKLTAEQVLLIRASPLPHRRISKFFGVTETRIRQVRKREGWTHV